MSPKWRPIQCGMVRSGISRSREFVLPVTGAPITVRASPGSFWMRPVAFTSFCLGGTAVLSGAC